MVDVGCIWIGVARKQEHLLELRTSRGHIEAFRATGSTNNFPRIWNGATVPREADNATPRLLHTVHGNEKRAVKTAPSLPPAKTGSRFVIAAWIIFCTTAREIRSPTSHPGSERSRQVSSHDTGRASSSSLSSHFSSSFTSHRQLVADNLAISHDFSLPFSPRINPPSC